MAMVDGDGYISCPDTEGYFKWLSENQEIIFKERYPSEKIRAIDSPTHIEMLARMLQMKEEEAKDESTLFINVIVTNLDDMDEDMIVIALKHCLETHCKPGAGSQGAKFVRRVKDEVLVAFGGKMPKLWKTKFDVPQEYWTDRNAIQTQRILERHRAPANIDAMACLVAIDKGLRSKSVSDKLCALMSICGARSIEILTKSKFENGSHLINSPDHGPYVIQKHIAKKTKGNEDIEVLKPLLLISFEDFNNHLIECREMCAKRYVSVRGVEMKDATNADITNFFNRWMCKSAKLMFPEIQSHTKKLGHPFGTHTLRSLYVVLAHSLVKTGTTLAAFATSVLGHQNGDLDTQRCYTTIQITRPLTPVRVVAGSEYGLLLTLKADNTRLRKELVNAVSGKNAAQADDPSAFVSMNVVQSVVAEEEESVMAVLPAEGVVVMDTEDGQGEKDGKGDAMPRTTQVSRDHYLRLHSKNKVGLRNSKGFSVLLPTFSRKRKTDNGDKIPKSWHDDRIRTAIRLLIANDIKVTRDCIKRFGIGAAVLSSFINRYRVATKRSHTQDEWGKMAMTMSSGDVVLPSTAEPDSESSSGDDESGVKILNPFPLPSSDVLPLLIDVPPPLPPLPSLKRSAAAADLPERLPSPTILDMVMPRPPPPLEEETKEEYVEMDSGYANNLAGGVNHGAYDPFDLGSGFEFLPDYSQPVTPCPPRAAPSHASASFGLESLLASRIPPPDPHVYVSALKKARHF